MFPIRFYLGADRKIPTTINPFLKGITISLFESQKDFFFSVIDIVI